MLREQEILHPNIAQLIQQISPQEFQEIAVEGAVYGLHDSPLGPMLVVLCQERLCGFLPQGNLSTSCFLEQAQQHLKVQLSHRYPHATEPFFQTVFHEKKLPPITLAGTPFQLKVWLALLNVPGGKVLTYQELAEMIQVPRSMRSIGQALKTNPLAYLLPCHRIISSSGRLGGYRWGSDLKKALLCAEGCQVSE